MGFCNFDNASFYLETSFLIPGHCQIFERNFDHLDREKHFRAWYPFTAKKKLIQRHENLDKPTEW